MARNFFFLLIFLSCALFAETEQEYDPYYYQDADPTCFESYYPYVGCPCYEHLIIQADYLYWTTQKCNLDYAVPWELIQFGVEKIGKVQEVDPDWNSGFRLGIFKTTDRLNYGVRYTNFQNSTTDTIKNADRRFRATRLDTDFTTFDFDFIKAKYHIHLQHIDSEIGYQPYFCDFCNGSIFAGFRYGCIDQGFHADYEAFEEEELSAFTFLKQTVDSHAYGLYIGAETAQHCLCGLGFYARAAFGAYVGHFKRRFDQTTGLELDSVIEIFEVDRLKDCCYRLMNTAEFSVALQYEFWEPGPLNSQWLIRIGYDYQHWFNTSDFMIIINDLNGRINMLDNSTDHIGFGGLVVRLQGIF